MLSRIWGASRRYGARFGVLGAALLVAGCDDGVTIAFTDRTPAMTSGIVRSMAQGGLPTEIHGAPWPGAAPEDVIRQLRLPNSFPPGLRFRLIPPAAPAPSPPNRLVLVFNPTGPLDTRAICRAGGAQSVEAPRDVGMRVYTVFCKGDASMGHADTHARKQNAGDWPEFVRVMRVTFMEILADYSGRTEK